MEVNDIETYINNWSKVNPQLKPLYIILGRYHPEIPPLEARNMLMKITPNDLFLMDICAFCYGIFERSKMITTLTTIADPYPINFCSISHLKLYNNEKQ